MNFPRTNLDTPPPDLTITRNNPDGSTTTQAVSTVPTYKYLGVIFDSKLTWKAHSRKAIANANWWTTQVARLSKTSGGMPPKRIRQLYNTVAIPAFTYAADIWFTQVRHSADSNKRSGSVSTTKKLTTVQRRMAKTITGALRTTAGDTLEAHANLLPIDLLFDKVIFRAAMRLASLPPTHPLHSHVRRAAKQYVKRHRSPLHHLFNINNIKPTTIETILPTRRRPGHSPAFTTSIPPNKTEALAEATHIHDTTTFTIYCDGSGYEGGIGAAAVLFTNSTETKHLTFHLGSDKEHTVYEGELVGILLALQLIKDLRSRAKRNPPAIGLDNQAAIRGLNNQRPHAAHYLLDSIHDATDTLRIPNLLIHWTPGHSDFHPNDRADELAKEAANGRSSPPASLPPILRKPLPTSITAARQTHLTRIRKRWKRRWKLSPRYAYTSRIDKSLPSNKYLKLVDNLNRQQSAILTQLRTGHAPLNYHLNRIKRSPSPNCPHCPNTPETIQHFLLICPHYARARYYLRRKVGTKSDFIHTLLSSPDTITPLLSFVNATKRLAPFTRTDPH